MKVADFGLSKEEVYDGRKSGLKGTYGYMDPDYMSTNKFTKKSDIYSFGIILFELITVINPQQGLLDYINVVSSLIVVHYFLKIFWVDYIKINSQDTKRTVMQSNVILGVIIYHWLQNPEGQNDEK